MVNAAREVPIVFCADEKYALYLPPLVQSIIEHSSADRHYRIIVLDCGIKPEDAAALKRQISQYPHFSLRFLSILDWLERHKNSLAQKGRFPPAMYGRLLIPDLLPDYEKVLYIDIDFIIQLDAGDILDVDIGDNYIAASADLLRDINRAHGDCIEAVFGLTDADYYLNSGLLVFNVKQWREHRLFQKCIARLEKQDLDLPDQDVLNIICKGKAAHLHQGCNVLGLMPALLEKEDFRIQLSRSALVSKAIEECKSACRSGKMAIHYAGSWRKPWFFPDVPLGQIWWHYAAKTELYARYIYDLNASPEKERVLAFHGLSKSASACIQPAAAAAPAVKIYYFLGIPLMNVKISAAGRKYCLGNFGGKLRFAMVKQRKRNKAVYLFGIKLFTVKSK